MRSIGWRLVVAIALALFLPFPGPHAGYTPIAATLLRRDALDADAAFWVIVAAALIVYTAAAFLLLSLVTALTRRR